MNIDIEKRVTEIITIAPKGEINSFTAPDLRQQFKQLLDKDTVNFVVDLSQIIFMDSAGMSALVSLLKGARQKGGDVKMVWSKEEKTNRIIKLTRFDRVFDIFDSAEAAIDSF